MKAILEFNLPEEQEEHRTALNGGKYYSVIWELGAYLRSLYKYENVDEKFKTPSELLDEIRKRYYEELEDLPEFN